MQGLCQASMVSTGEKSVQQDFGTLDRHIRSASFLAQIMWYSGDVLAEPGTNYEGKTNKIVATLTNLAHCLVRLPGENVAVGLLEGSVVAANTSSWQQTSVPASEQLIIDELVPLHQGLYAKNKSNAGGKGPSAPRNAPEEIEEESTVLRRIMKTAYFYRTTPQLK